jgi:signal transduction histidine kinase
MKRIAHAIRTGFGTDGSEPGNDAARDDAESSPGAAGDEDDVEVSKLAHELRTPLSAIVVAAEIMKDQRLGELANERYRSYSADIADNARHALAVINRLLGEAAAASGAGLESKPLDLNALAEGAVSAMRPLAEEAKLTLTQELHTRLPAVLADAMTVKQILFNLLTNAVKFTKPPGDVRVVTGLGFDRSVFIAVQDQGAGMTPEEIARALDAEAPPNPEPKQAGGLGIGLPLAVSLAKANGARLEIDSKPGEGTAVALIFPKDRVATTP